MPKTHLYLFKRSNGIWYILSRAGDTIKWKSTGCTIKGDALRYLREFEDIETPQKLPIKKLSQFATEFLGCMQPVYSTKTYYIYDCVLKRLKALCGDVRLTEISPRDWDRYTASRIHLISPVSLSFEHRALKSLMNKAQKWGYIITSPFTGMRNIKIPETYPKYFTREEFQQKWQDVDLGRRVVTIQCPPLS